jgi:hypothetical protein
MKKREMIKEISRYTTVSPLTAIRLCCWSHDRLYRVIKCLRAYNEVYNDCPDYATKIKRFNR